MAVVGGPGQGNNLCSANPQSFVNGFDTFHPFPKLPIELRVQVWDEALPAGRVIEVEWCPKAEAWFCPIESRQSVCGLYRANKESRDEYLKVYFPLLLYDSSSPGHTVQGQKRAMSYFNANVDTLYIGPSTCDRTTSIFLPTLFRNETLGNLKFLAIAAEENPWYDEEVLQSLTAIFPDLQLLTAVCCDASIWSAPESYKDNFDGSITWHPPSDDLEFPNIYDGIMTKYYTTVKDRRLAGRGPFPFDLEGVRVLRGGNKIECSQDCNVV